MDLPLSIEKIDPITQRLLIRQLKQEIVKIVRNPELDEFSRDELVAIHNHIDIGVKMRERGYELIRDFRRSEQDKINAYYERLGFKLLALSVCFGITSYLGNQYYPHELFCLMASSIPAISMTGFAFLVPNN